MFPVRLDPPALQPVANPPDIRPTSAPLTSLIQASNIAQSLQPRQPEAALLPLSSGDIDARPGCSFWREDPPSPPPAPVTAAQPFALLALPASAHSLPIADPLDSVTTGMATHLRELISKTASTRSTRQSSKAERRRQNIELLTAPMVDDNGKVNHERQQQKLSLLKSLLERAKAGHIVDLRGADLRYLDLSGLNLSGAQFADCLLANTHLQRCNMTNCIISGSDLRGATLDHAILRGATLSNNVLTEASCRHAVFDGATINGSWRGAYLHDASMRNVNIAGADFTDTEGLPAQFSLALPESWDLSARKIYLHAQNPLIISLLIATDTLHNECSAFKTASAKQLVKALIASRTPLNNASMNESLLNILVRPPYRGSKNIQNLVDILIKNMDSADACTPRYKSHLALLRKVRPGNLNAKQARAFDDTKQAALDELLALPRDGKMLNLRGVDLTSLRLVNARLKDIDFRWSTLVTFSFNNCTLHNVNMQAAFMNGCYLTGCQLTDVNLAAAVLSHARITNTHMAGISAPRAIFSRAHLSQACLQRAELSSAMMSGMILNEVDLDHAVLTGASLARSYLRGGTLCYADLTSASLVDADAQTCDMSNAQLTSCDLSRITLETVKLTNAVMHQSRFDGAELQSLNLTGLDLSTASMNNVSTTGVLFNNTTLNGSLTLRLPAWNGRTLDYYLNHFANSSGSILTSINSIDSRYHTLKIQLAQQLVESLTGVDVSPIYAPLIDVLSAPKWRISHTVNTFMIGVIQQYLAHYNRHIMPHQPISIIQATLAEYARTPQLMLARDQHHAFIQLVDRAIHCRAHVTENNMPDVLASEILEVERMRTARSAALNPNAGNAELAAFATTSNVFHGLWTVSQQQATAATLAAQDAEETAKRVYTQYLRQPEIKQHIEHPEIADFFGNFAGDVEWTSRVAENYLLLPAQQDGPVMLLSSETLQTMLQPDAFTAWDRYFLFQDHQPLRSLHFPPRELFEHYFPLLLPVYLAQENLALFSGLLETLNLGEYHPLFLAALSQSTSTHKLTDAAAQGKLGEIFRPLLQFDAKNSKRCYLNAEHYQTILAKYALSESRAEEKATTLLALATVFCRYSASAFFGEEFESPQLLRQYAYAVMAQAYRLYPTLFFGQDHQLFSQEIVDLFPLWEARLLGLRREYSCTNVLADNMHRHLMEKCPDKLAQIYPPAWN